MVQTATLEGDDRQKFQRLLIDAIASAPDLRVVSLYLQFKDEVTDAARPDAPIMHISGAARLKIDLLGLVFEIGPLSFFSDKQRDVRLTLREGHRVAEARRRGSTRRMLWGGHNRSLRGKALQRGSWH